MTVILAIIVDNLAIILQGTWKRYILVAYVWSLWFPIGFEFDGMLLQFMLFRLLELPQGESKAGHFKLLGQVIEFTQLLVS